MDLNALPEVFGVSVVAPIWGMGLLARPIPDGLPLGLVNVSPAAAVRGVAGRGGNGASKAALRLAGMAFAAEVEAATGRPRREIRVLAYGPGTVDTPMQLNARTSSRDVLPSVDLFVGFAARGALVSPDEPAADIAEFLASG